MEEELDHWLHKESSLMTTWTERFQTHKETPALTLELQLPLKCLKEKKTHFISQQKCFFHSDHSLAPLSLSCLLAVSLSVSWLHPLCWTFWKFVRDRIILSQEDYVTINLANLIVIHCFHQSPLFFVTLCFFLIILDFTLRVCFFLDFSSVICTSFLHLDSYIKPLLTVVKPSAMFPLI